ncbi:DUF7500 family protein [Salarchaeum japonicum]|uniref:Uncharacterized protein n=1 Tax=Salarchaeum japonicum TaxID=555573 RepID=A0AAV3T0G3_9EURY|nr:hypothetical protein [Salarchaeum japonicum]
MADDSNPTVEDVEDVPPEDLAEDGVLSPEDLDVEGREEVEEIGDGRYVVSTSEGRSPDPRPADDLPGETDDSPTPAETPSAAAALSAVPEQYAAALAVKTDHGVADERFASNNVVDTFERALRWYAHRIDPSEPPEDVLRVLLAESDLDL